MLLAETHERVYTSGMPVYREPVSHGQNGEEETAASQWPLVRCIYNRARCEKGANGRSLTARKHTLESTDGLCKPVPDQESGNSFSYLIWSILMDCVATLR